MAESKVRIEKEEGDTEKLKELISREEFRDLKLRLKKSEFDELERREKALRKQSWKLRRLVFVDILKITIIICIVAVTCTKIGFEVHKIIKQEQQSQSFNLIKEHCESNCSGIASGRTTITSNPIYKLFKVFLYHTKEPNCRHLRVASSWKGDCYGILSSGKFADCLENCGALVLSYGTFISYFHQFIVYNSYLIFYILIIVHLPLSAAKWFFKSMVGVKDLRITLVLFCLFAFVVLL